MPTNARRLVELSMVPELAKEVAAMEAATKIASVPAVGTDNATDLATVITLANALKTRLNELIAALKA
jgi:hypothetical protein